MDVVYTPWFNLKKTPSMDVGQVGFHNPKMVTYCLLYIYSFCISIFSQYVCYNYELLGEVTC